MLLFLWVVTLATLISVAVVVRADVLVYDLGNEIRDQFNDLPARFGPQFPLEGESFHSFNCVLTNIWIFLSPRALTAVTFVSFAGRNKDWLLFNAPTIYYYQISLNSPFFFQGSASTR